jgi:DNA polymerase III epsilon subunit-like protein
MSPISGISLKNIYSKYVVVDFEGTPAKPRQAAFLAVNNGVITSCKSVESEQEMTQFICSMLYYKTQYVIVSHHKATEEKFLNQLFPYPAPMHAHHAFPPVIGWGPWLDTWKLAGQHLSATSLELSELIKHLKLEEDLSALAQIHRPGKTYHDALYDCIATHLVYNYILTKHSDKLSTFHTNVNPTNYEHTT